MAWRDIIKSRPASFRGVPFRVNTSDLSGGRRKVKHQFPERDFPHFEDIGRENRAFAIEGFVLGADYLTDKENLIAALENPEIGTLQHPYYGRKEVVSITFSVSESTLEGGIAVFTMNFEEAEEAEPAGVIVESVEEELNEKADELAADIQESFSENFSVENMPGFFVEEAAGWLETLSEAYETSMQYIEQVEDFAQDVADYITAVQEIAEKAVSFVQDPLSLVRAVTSIYDDVLQITDNAQQLYNYLESLLDFGADFPEISETTEIRTRQKNNQDALIDLVQAMTVANAARMAGRLDYESGDDAEKDRDRLLEKIEEITTRTKDNEIFRILSNIKFPVTKIVSNTQRRVIEINEPVSVPELVLSWRLYGTPQASIAERNNFDNPGFLLGNLKVLSNV